MSIFIAAEALPPQPTPALPPQPPAPQPQPAPHQPRQRRRARPPIFRTRVLLFGMPDDVVVRRYRLPPHLILDTLSIIESDLESEIRYPTAIPPLTQFLAVLHFLATASYQHVVGDLVGMSQGQFSKVLRRVCQAFLKRVKQFIDMPLDVGALDVVKRQFEEGGSRFPHVIGVVDGTHVAIQPPRHNEEIYRNRKLFHSLNVMVVCGPSLQILSLNAKFTGSSHDAYVIRQSGIWQRLRASQRADMWLLGDRGYPCTPWLMTPYRNPRPGPQMAFNSALTATRQLVERTIGVLKGRFRVLHRTGGDIMYSPEMASKIVVLCAILHNIAVRSSVELPQAEELPDEEPGVVRHFGGGSVTRRGSQVRARIVAEYFRYSVFILFLC
ncbi:putative nuclease HARBI1 isoform X1 [Pseudophryne corroboree]|uniref:putative nuclease HARBI1 isoform X1 n=2 Tax=Pseudophryne corroboree TaxID=495146 RepID=UPI0030818912